MSERTKARHRIVFEKVHGINYDVADDIFCDTWNAATTHLTRQLEIAREALERIADDPYQQGWQATQALSQLDKGDA